MESIAAYQDWIYIGAVLVAFLVFLFWNKGKQSNHKNRRRRNFKASVRAKKKAREEEEKDQ